MPVRSQRNGLAEWLDLHPGALSQLPGEALAALGLSLDASRAAEEKIRKLRSTRAVLEKQVGQLQALALSDPLTGAASRRALEVRLLQECNVMRRTGQPFAVFLLDADNLKQVNDTHGHGAGDDYLRELTRRLVDNVRGMDLVARLGGDEFVLVCPQTGAEGAAELESRLAVSLAEDVLLRGERVRMSVSQGWVIADADRVPVELLEQADAAMYRAKAMRHPPHLTGESRA